MEEKKELNVLKETLAECKRFEAKLKALIAECKEKNKPTSKKRASLKRSALDLKNHLSEITTASGCYGTYYYKEDSI